MVDQELAKRQMIAGYMLLMQSLGLLLPGTYMVISLLSSFLTPRPLEFLILYFVLIGPAFIPLAIGIMLFRGRFASWVLYVWIVVSVLFAAFALYMTIPLLIMPYIYFGTNLVFVAGIASLIAAPFVFRFVSRYGTLQKMAASQEVITDPRNPL